MAMNSPLQNAAGPTAERPAKRPPRASVRQNTSGIGVGIPALDQRAQKAVARAVRLLEESAVYRVEAMSSPLAVRTYLKLKLGALEQEEFHALWLDTQLRIIAFDCLAVGTLAHTSVYPREAVKTALRHNASGVIFAHNHPSGVTEPSTADETLTRTLKQALALVDVRVHDHFIVGGAGNPLSFAERGLL